MEDVDQAFARTFGNYNLHGIEEVHLPETVSWMPQTIGWKVVAGVLLLAFIYCLIRKAQGWWRNRYRREALKQLKQLEVSEDLYTVVCHLPFLLKATALQRFPRSIIAPLSGEDWLSFLSGHYPGPSFNDPLGRQLIAVSYQHKPQWTLQDDEAKALIERTRSWIKTHQAKSSSPLSSRGVTDD